MQTAEACATSAESSVIGTWTIVSAQPPATSVDVSHVIPVAVTLNVASPVVGVSKVQTNVVELPDASVTGPEGSGPVSGRTGDVGSQAIEGLTPVTSAPPVLVTVRATRMGAPLDVVAGADTAAASTPGGATARAAATGPDSTGKPVPASVPAAVVERDTGPASIPV